MLEDFKTAFTNCECTSLYAPTPIIFKNMIINEKYRFLIETRVFNAKSRFITEKSWAGLPGVSQLGLETEF